MMKNKLSPMRNTFIYSGIFLVVFISVIYIKFPNDRLKTWISSQIIASTNINYVDIKTAKLKPALKIELKGITLKKNTGLNVQIDKAVLKPSMLSLLSSNVSVPFHIGMNDGSLFGDIVFSRENREIKSLDIDIEHLDFNKVSQIYSPAVSNKATIGGYLFGSLKINDKSMGDFQFNIDDLDISNISVGKMKLPDFPDLKATLKGKMVGNNTVINELSFVNDDISLNLSGSMPPLWKLSRGSIDLYYKLQVKSGKYAYMKSFLAKDEQGNHAGKIGGTLGNPVFVGNTGNMKNKSRNMRQGIEDRTNLFKPQEKLSL